MTERLHTVREVAESLRVHVETVRRWIRDGRLPATRLGDRSGYRIADSDLRRFVDEMKTAPRVELREDEHR